MRLTIFHNTFYTRKILRKWLRLTTFSAILCQITIEDGRLILKKKIAIKPRGEEGVASFFFSFFRFYSVSVYLYVFLTQSSSLLHFQYWSAAPGIIFGRIDQLSSKPYTADSSSV